MGAGHASLGYVDARSWLHTTAAHHKILATFAIVLAVVTVPVGTWWPFGVAMAVVLAAAVTAGLRPGAVLRRMIIEIPFVVFALALPFFAHGPRIEVLGLSVSRPGLIAAGAMLIKATLGVLAGIILSSTTRPADLITGLQRLRLPTLLVQITAFMLRYFSVVSDDLHRMRIARESRAFAGSGFRQARAVAASAGTLFVRSYERGERVHLAMLSRGHDGRTHVEPIAVAPRTWLTAMTLPLAAALVLVGAMVSR